MKEIDMQTAILTGADLSYWVARANMHGHTQESNILRRHYGDMSRNDPIDEPAMRAFVETKIGKTLPERSTWQ
jgi:hypothetical protein